MRWTAALIALLAPPAAAQDACTREAAPCETPLGTYRVALPEGTAPVGAVMFLHGFGGSGAGVLGMSGMIRALVARGYAVIAPDGTERSGGGGRRWSFLPDAQRPRARDEVAFLRGVADDAAARFDLPEGAMVLAGFSAGGFMVNYLACDAPDAFAAYAPVSGGFWRPHPEGCVGPVRLLHTHGFRDGTVPLEGRPLGGGAYVQGDIFEGLGIWRDANGCRWDAPDGYAEMAGFQRRRWDCAAGSALEFALFDGGHGVPAGWAGMMLDWFEALPPAPPSDG